MSKRKQRRRNAVIEVPGVLVIVPGNHDVERDNLNRLSYSVSAFDKTRIQTFGTNDLKN